MIVRTLIPFILACLLSCPIYSLAQGVNPQLTLKDVFDLEYASDPQISPDGSQVIYARNFMDIMKDRRRSNLWIVNFDGSEHRPLTTGNGNDTSPRWSPDGNKLLYVSSVENARQLFIRWMDTGQSAKLANLQKAPGNITWSPDGKWIAFTMFVEEAEKSLIKMPAKPEGAEWATPAIYIDEVKYRADGQGYLKKGHTQIFVLPVEGGTPRQLTSGPFNHGGSLSWAPDSNSLFFSANRHENADFDTRNSEVFELTLTDGILTPLTSRQGPDNSPSVSPDGSKIAYTGFDDQYLGYQVTRLYVMDRDGKNARMVSGDLDRDVQQHTWSTDGKGLYFKYDDKGNTKLAYMTLKGRTEVLAKDLGGLSLGRPYGGSSYSVAPGGQFAFTLSRPSFPADLAVGKKGIKNARRVTMLNEDLLGYKQLGEVEEIWYSSSHDSRQIHGWIVKPPNFDPAKKYPLLLEIHGGPFSNYGDRFSAEIQLFAAAGYVVLYTNPRGSTSYGGEFGNLIHHNYPGEDYDDLMSGVDAVIEKGYIDEENLFVTGGSGGGVLSSWIIGNTNRFAAAVVAKPVINWYSFVLNSDNPGFFYKYWFPGLPWEHEAHYMSRSPISKVGNVTTPTMLITGEADYRTPISETEQYYAALKLQGVDAAMVRIPDAPHGITGRPSNLITKVAYVLKWFEKYQTDSVDISME